MADGARDKNGSKDQRVRRSRSLREAPESRRKLGQTRLGKAGARVRRQPVADPSAMARGFRLSTELVAGVIVGAMMGWLLDRWLGISPWGLIVFLLLGFAAGVLNVMRAAGVSPGKRPGGYEKH